METLAVWGMGLVLAHHPLLLQSGHGAFLQLRQRAAGLSDAHADSASLPSASGSFSGWLLSSLAASADSFC